MSRILVVEDDIVISQVVCEFLKEHGYQVESVFDGKVALERFPRRTIRFNCFRYHDSIYDRFGSTEGNSQNFSDSNFDADSHG